MDQSVLDMDRNVHTQLYGEEHFPFSRRAIIEQIQQDFNILINFIRHPSSSSPLVFLFLLLILPITLLATQSFINYSPRAQTVNTVKVSFSPSTVNLPPASKVKIMIDSRTQKVPFARIVFTFDKSKVKLTSEITPSSRLSTVVEKTTMLEANSQGKAILVIAASPSDILPSGSFDLASFSVDAISSSIGQTSLNFSPNEIQIVDSTGNESIISLSNLGINGPADSVISPTPYSGSGSGIKGKTGGNPNVNIPPPNSNPSKTCNSIGSILCYNQWFREFAGVENTKFADLNNDGKVTLLDFEFWRRAAYP